jgi:pimeloyl-ACP methyl ester carboxylesterase
MTQETSSRTRNSTTVRSIPVEVQAMRLALRGLGAVVPGAAGTLAARMFFRPRRSPRAAPPSVPGLEARPFTVAAGRERLAAWSWGSGPTVVLVHGWEGWAGQMAGFVEPLVRAGFRAVAFDMPAHGSSTGKSASVVDFACAIRRVAKLSKPVHGVVAHSMGGAAASLAVAEGLAAERVVLMAPGADPMYFARRLAGWMGLSKASTEAMLRGVLRRFGGSWVEVEVPNLVRAVQTPMLLLHDPEDDDVPWEHGRAIAGAWPGARLEAVQGLGHRRILRDAEVIGRAVRFVASRGLEALSIAV